MEIVLDADGREVKVFRNGANHDQGVAIWKSPPGERRRANPVANRTAKGKWELQEDYPGFEASPELLATIEESWQAQGANEDDENPIVSIDFGDAEGS